MKDHVWREMGVALQHFPILVACHQSNTFDRQPRFEQPTGRLVPQIVEVQVFDIERFASTPEVRADASWIVWEDATREVGRAPVFLKNLLCIESRQVGKRHILVVPVLFPGVLAVPDLHHASAGIDVGPFDPCDFTLAHRCCYCKPNDT